MKIFYAVDIQRDFMNEDGALYVPGAEDIKSNIHDLCSYARAGSISLWASLDWHEEDDVEFKTFPKHCVKNTDGAQLIGEVAFHNPGPLFFKTTYDVFAEPYIERALEYYKVDEAIVFGVAADICVQAAVLGLLKKGIKCYVVEDAIKGVFPDKTETAIKGMKEAGAVFITTKQILKGELDGL